MTPCAYSYDETRKWVVEGAFGYLCYDTVSRSYYYSDDVAEASMYQRMQDAEWAAGESGLSDYRFCRIVITREITTYDRGE